MPYAHTFLCRGSVRFDLKLHALVDLKGLDDAQQAFGGGIASRSQHPVKALAGFFERAREAFERNRRVDVVAQHGLARRGIAGQQWVDRLGQRPLSEPRVTCGAFHDRGAEGSYHRLQTRVLFELFFDVLTMRLHLIAPLFRHPHHHGSISAGCFVGAQHAAPYIIGQSTVSQSARHPALARGRV